MSVLKCICLQVCNTVELEVLFQISNKSNSFFFLKVNDFTDRILIVRELWQKFPATVASRVLLQNLGHGQASGLSYLLLYILYSFRSRYISSLCLFWKILSLGIGCVSSPDEWSICMWSWFRIHCISNVVAVFQIEMSQIRFGGRYFAFLGGSRHHYLCNCS